MKIAQMILVRYVNQDFSNMKIINKIKINLYVKIIKLIIAKYKKK